MSNSALLAARYARRPLLLEPGAADALLRQLALGDPRGMHSEGRLEAILRKIGVGRARAQDVHDDAAESAANAVCRPGCYTPLWAQQSYGEPQDEGFAWSLYEGIALMECATAISDRGEEWCGTWYHGYDTLLAGMREALADERTKGLFVRMRTPGGVVDGGMYALTAFMRKARAAAGGKPIHFHVDMACSAGFWIICNGDRTTSSPVGLVGSVGAVIVHEDWSEGLKKQGLALTPITFGSKKVDGASWAPLSASAKADWQSEIDQIGRDFIAGVIAGRPSLTAEALLDTQAGVFMADNDDKARSGLALGLIDDVMDEQEAFAELLERVSPAVGGVKAIVPASGAAAAVPATPVPQQEAPTPMKTLKTVARVAAGALRPATAAAAPAAKAAEGAEAAEAAAVAMECPTCNGTGSVDGETCPDCDGTGEELVEQGESEAAAPAAAAPNVAKAIAATPEAKANPAHALAAIEAGLSVAQFKAMAAAQPAAPAASALDRRMSGAKRLGADGVQPAEGKTTLGSALVADAEARRSARKG